MALFYASLSVGCDSELAWTIAATKWNSAIIHYNINTCVQYYNIYDSKWAEFRISLLWSSLCLHPQFEQQ